ncbi:hypothetical protein [Labrys sp. 22185]|uniref:hypothetical protein n=1 Tax=Labrys sp. 22185 TaxID=3453888 RepID=UPI003F82E4F4
MADQQRPPMPGPGRELDISDRIPECEEAMEPAFLAVIDEAVAAGWSKVEAAIALSSLADHCMLGVKCNEELEAQLDQLIPGRKRPPREIPF